MRVKPGFIHRMFLIITTLGAIGCGTEDPKGSLAPSFQNAQSVAADPSGESRRITLPFAASNFVGGVQNPYWPLVPGTVLTYRQETSEGLETNTVEITHDTKVILGVTTFVVRDRVYLEGDLKEDTFDWYAPDRSGNVWYFGEDTKEIENGVPVSTAGSWEAGVAGAKAGIIMLARPRIGDTYYQENAPGVVEDQGRVKALNQTVTVPFGTFSGCVKTQEWTPLEPGNRAFKYYAPGVGTVLEVPNHGGGLVELISVTGP